MIWISVILLVALIALYARHWQVLQERKCMSDDYARALDKIKSLTAEVEALRTKRRRAQRAAVLGLIEGELND